MGSALPVPLKRDGYDAAISQWLPELLSPERVAASELPSSYRALKIPIIVIWGERDTITPLAQGQYLKRITPGASLTVLPGVGHIPQIETTSTFNELLVDQLRILAPVVVN